MMPDPEFKAQLIRGRGYRFEPKSDIADKQNVGRHLFIGRDGEVSEAIRLNVLDDRLREDIIAFHFCQQYGQIMYGEDLQQPQFYVVGRDSPWDFEYVMHDGSTFNLEIRRIAETTLLRAMKAENDCSLLLMRDNLKGYEVRKIERHFPGILPSDIVELAMRPEGKNQLFHCKVVDPAHRMYLRPPMNPKIDLAEKISRAVEAKAKKKHHGKRETILIIDNLTTHNDPDEFFDAMTLIREQIESTPFPAIWLYTGYYSDLDGFNSEYSIIPLKADAAILSRLVGVSGDE